MASKKSKSSKRPSTTPAAKKKATKKVVRKTAKKSAKKAVKKTAKKVGKRPTKKASKKVAKKATRKKAGSRTKKGADDNELILVAVRGMVLFPGVVLPISVGRPKSVAAIQAAVQSGRPIGVLLQSNPDADNPTSDDLYRVGTRIEILRYVTAPDGTHHVVAQGVGRFRVKKFMQRRPYFTAQTTPIPEVDPQSLTIDQRRDIHARFLALKAQAHEALALLPQAPDDLDAAIENAPHPGMLADLVATFMDVPPEDKQELLEIADLKERLHRVTSKLGELTAVLKMSSDIRDETKGNLEKAQREYFLREQLRTIQKELGEGISMEIQELGEKVTAAGMPADVEAVARKELARLERIPEAAAEYSMVRTYLDWMIDLPWSKSTADQIDLGRAEEILDADHYGLERVKRRVLEFLAVRKLKPAGKGPILCLSGPPGTGKTSLGRSIARAMGREFIRISLGGVHDEAEIRGHRRTYVGAMPGKIIQSLKRAEVNNPVFLLDEMDKLSTSFNGDPAAALLEVLDPAQNKTFSDHYLDVPFDLSKVLFLATANYLENIPGPLRDRMEVIELSSYTENEKIEIAKRYLLPRQTAENGLSPDHFALTETALTDIVRYYTSEAGCRNLEREIGTVARYVAADFARQIASLTPVDDDAANGSAEGALDLSKTAPMVVIEDPQSQSIKVATQLESLPTLLPREIETLQPAAMPAEDKASEDEADETEYEDDGTSEMEVLFTEEEPVAPSLLLRYPSLEKITIDVDQLAEILGPRKYESDVALRTAEPGVATGLAWTPVGGVILFVEAARMPGKGNMVLTGQLGDVMRESATAAMSLLKARAEHFGINPEVFEKTDIHIHLPEGATPKDGPSAGITLYTTLVSLFTGRKVKSDLAMTGEINLRGLVLPVGGIKEKVLAAYRAGLRRVILPRRNEKDVIKIPKIVRDDLEIHFAERVDDVLAIALCEPEAPTADPKTV